MKAVVLKDVTNSDDIVLEELETPKAKKGWILVKILAFGMNHSELVLRVNEIRADYINKPIVPGIECVGIVVDSLDEGFEKGDLVCSLMGGLGRNFNGSYEEYAILPVFLLTESYLFRRNICDLPTNALNKIFLMLHREIIRYDGSSSQYFEKFKFALLSKSDRARFPMDEEFIEAFAKRPVYQMNMKNKLYILERLENHDTLETKEIYAHCDDGTYSIEHIMPQHLTPAWISELGEGYEEIHETWLHRLANLTLTAYNSKYRKCFTSLQILTRNILQQFRKPFLPHGVPCLSV